MLVTMPHALRLVAPVRRAVRADGAGRVMAWFALVGAGLLAAAVVLAVRGSPSALLVGVAGVVVQVGGFLGALWWAVRHTEPRSDGRRP
jgi:hypothetical protein